MIILLKILLYLQLIPGPAQYRESEIYYIEAAHQPQVSMYMNDQALLGAIPQEYQDLASQIVIIDDTEEQ